MEPKEKEPKEEVVLKEQEEQQEKDNNEVGETYVEIMKEMIANKDNYYFRNLKVISATVTMDVENPFVTITVDKNCKGYINYDNNGIREFKLADTNVIKMSIKTLITSLKYSSENMAMILPKLRRNPEYIELLLPGFKLDIVQVQVHEGVPYKQPFSSIERYTTPENDSIYTYVAEVVPNETIKQMAKQMNDKLIDIFMTL